MKIRASIIVGIMGGLITLLINDEVTFPTFAGIFFGATLVALINNKWRFGTDTINQALVIFFTNVIVVAIFKLVGQLF